MAVIAHVVDLEGGAAEQVALLDRIYGKVMSLAGGGEMVQPRWCLVERLGWLKAGVGGCASMPIHTDVERVSVVVVLVYGGDDGSLYGGGGGMQW
ncbi:hypothetical protein L2E82_49675 [Cichorium intybus]|uniref:Uncharacterized protein n=1 Tax=Cichorium intybus TaxID=13427 RepID=A0ACB8Z0T2_CICIN|nr:hypothetical protein L2E82_49675 [Cichorium intybus]